MDAVLREVLRLYAPAPNTIRESTESVVLSLGTPVIGRDGRLIEDVHIPRGTTLFIRACFSFFNSRAA